MNNNSAVALLESILFAILMTFLSTLQLYDLYLVGNNIEHDGSSSGSATSLFYNVSGKQSLAFHLGLSYVVALSSGPCNLFLLLIVIFSGVPGAPSKLQMIRASLFMALLQVVLYIFQGYLMVTSNTFYYDCLGNDFWALMR